MKLKVDGMSEKPTNADTSESREPPEPPDSSEGSARGLELQGDHFPDDQHGAEKQVSIALEEIEEIENDVRLCPESYKLTY